MIKDMKLYRVKTIVFFLSLILIADCIKGCASGDGGTSKVPLTPTEIAVSLNADLDQGGLDPIFTAGMYLNEIPATLIQDKFFSSEQRTGYTEVIIPFVDNNTLAAPQTYLINFDKSATMQVIRKVNVTNGKLVINLTPDSKTDPTNWKNWVKAFVTYLKSQVQIPTYYVVRDEPDKFWDGDETTYFNIYSQTAAAIKEVDMSIKIGGVSTTKIDGKCCLNNNYSNTDPMLLNFVKFVVTNSVPLDFIIWHRFNPNPYGTDFENDALTVKTWLKSASFAGNPELVIGSWNSWKEFGKRSDELSPDRDTEYLASYILPNLLAMANAGISSQMLFCLSENWQTNTVGEFVGGFGIFTRSGVIKPVYNAFKMISMMAGNKIQVTSGDPYLTVLATQTDNKFYILLSSFIPENGRDGWVKGVIFANPSYLDVITTVSLDYLKLLMQETRQFTSTEITNLISAIESKNEAQLALIIAGFSPGEQNTLKTIQAKVSNDINAFFFQGQVYPSITSIVTADGFRAAVDEIRYKAPQLQQQYPAREGTSANVTISLSKTNISGNYTAQTYQVAPNYGNSYSLRSQIESALSSGTLATTINGWKDVDLQAISGTASVQNNSIQISQLSVSPYSSTLIVLTPQP